MPVKLILLKFNILAIFERSGSSTAVPERDGEANVLSGKQDVRTGTNTVNCILFDGAVLLVSLVNSVS